MSAAASVAPSPGTPHPKKAAQQHMIHNLAALAMLLDEDAVEQLILTLLRDNDMVGMLYHRSGITELEEDVLEEVYDAGELFDALNTHLWEEGRKFLASKLACAAIESAAVGRVPDKIQLVGGSGVAGGCAAAFKNEI